ncbi:MAG: CHAP domain-containing protein [bacterium]|nr:CHAP domain-containing protein [bacterium]
MKINKTMIIVASILGGIAALGGGYMSLSENISKKLDEFIGVTEIKGNQGFSNPAFEALMKAAGWIKGQAWCMYLARMVWKNTMPELVWNEAKKLISGSTQGSYNAVKNSKSNVIFITDRPQKGFIAVWQSKMNPTLGHAGIVKSVNADNTFNDVEGNTNRLDSREGEGVYAKKRNLTGISSDLLLRGFIGFKVS